MSTIQSKPFGKTSNGELVTAFTLENRASMRVVIIDYGAAIQSIFVKDKGGEFIDVCLGYDDVESYEKGTCFYGAIVGRCANRIKGAKFTIDGNEYHLEKNEGENHNHGIFSKRMFKARVEGDVLVMNYLSPDLEEGYPGNLDLEVRYHLSEDNAIEITYKATTDKPTILNVTNHCYFNLNGPDGSTIYDHKISLNCSAFSEYDETFAQTGNIISVEGTPLDFRTTHTIGERFNDDYPQLRLCTGYDHNMILDGENGELKMIGTLTSDKTGIVLESFTTEPAIQFYVGNYIQCDPLPHGKNGVIYPRGAGVALEAQHYPDAINHPNFPSTLLRPGEIYRQKTIYRFK